jgi:hypothetical protein
VKTKKEQSRTKPQRTQTCLAADRDLQRRNCLSPSRVPWCAKKPHPDPLQEEREKKIHFTLVLLRVPWCLSVRKKEKNSLPQSLKEHKDSQRRKII